MLACRISSLRQLNQLKAISSWCSTNVVGSCFQSQCFIQPINCEVNKSTNQILNRSWIVSHNSFSTSAAYNIDESSDLMQEINATENIEQLEKLIFENQNELNQFTLGQASTHMSTLEGNPDRLIELLIQKFAEIEQFTDANSIYSFIRGLGLLKVPTLTPEQKKLLSEQINNNVQDFDTEQIQSILHKFVMLRMRPHFLVNKLVNKFCSQIDDARIESLSKTIWSVGILQTKISQDRRRDFRIALLQKIDEYDLIGLTQVFRGMSEMQWKNTSLLQALCQRAQKLFQEQKDYQLRSLVNISQCLFKLEFYNTDLIEFLVQQIKQNIDDLSPRDCVHLMNGMLSVQNVNLAFESDEVKQESQQLLERLIQEVSVNMRELSPSFWYLLFDSVSEHLEFLSKNIQFTTSFLKVVQENIQYLNARQASQCLRLISHAHDNQVNLQQLDVKELIQVFIGVIKEADRKPGPQDSADAILALASLGVQDEELQTMLTNQNQTTNF